ncbi:MAG TPA: ubiquinone biosynthesis protein UbiE, partial [Anaerolineae bacterium]|nr:ubiquinone biosynthesis protein UbiE [Anaerolineae bacterium]
MNHQQFFDQAAANWDALIEEQTLIRLQAIV